MNRRTILRSGGVVVGSLGLAGCTGLLETEQRPTGRIPPIPENRPDGVYIPSHVEGMDMSGMASEGDYKFGLMYSYAHRFWNVNADSVSLTEIEEGDDVHLMTVVWDPETNTVLPDTGLSVEISDDTGLVSEEAIYPMLSQPMGFHYGANFGLNGEKTYTVKLSVGAMSTRRTGAFADRFAEPATVEVPFEYSESAKNEIMLKLMEERAATAGAVDPMGMEMMPSSAAPAESELPGRVVGSSMSNDARLIATVLDAPPAGIDGDGQYLAVSARTRYNRMILPAMALDGTVARDGKTVFEGELVRTLDPDLNYHYGAVVDSVESGDELTLSVTTQPQTARHEGYETAFGGLKGEMPDVTITVE
ncbi:iron transporter [Halorientalis marina]|uniref:iron transporter n=1 Tax=Halorientalis marina TaxID=2931976 RepID=UPI001FF5A8A8|nr:iron transporter [Halorientalis marina]